MRFIVEPFLSRRREFISRRPRGACALNPGHAYRLTVAFWPTNPSGPKVGPPQALGPGDRQSRLRPAGAMTEVLPSQGHAALTADPRSREAPYEGINYRALRPGT